MHVADTREIFGDSGGFTFTTADIENPEAERNNRNRQRRATDGAAELLEGAKTAPVIAGSGRFDGGSEQITESLCKL